MKNLLFLLLMLVVGNCFAGTCVMISMDDSIGDIEREFVPDITKEQCQKYDASYIQVDWFDTDDIESIKGEIKGCRDYRCQFPCLYRRVCTCAPGRCS